MFSKRRLIVCRVGGGDGGFSGKLALGEAVEPVGLARHGDAVGDVGPFAVELVGLDDKGAHIPAGHAGHDITNHCGDDGRDQPARARLEHAAGNGDCRAQSECRADEQHADERDVRVGVGDSIEDRVLLEEEFEAADIFMNGQRKEQESGGD